VSFDRNQFLEGKHPMRQGTNRFRSSEEWEDEGGSLAPPRDATSWAFAASSRRAMSPCWCRSRRWRCWSGGWF